ncbi:hypothetical protein [Rhodonellum sp.]|uniref:hypothetical protein n=1 Tax=Rhodonellum sp. TaxID=2231180 RepID=UPI0027266B93|nr:hypothetical protein [Rhodonellum sp.]MDO9553371.1 hypothetical protein [Rhodonellum sp.]
MPIGEIETHPYLQQGQITGATKLILGSFPVYEYTDHDNAIKQQNRQHEGSVRFFYGSIDSGLWGLYSKHLDNLILLPPDPSLIIQSLAQRQIVISDTIASCERHGLSSEDSKLIRRSYNREGIQSLIQNGVRKILCTSKGVLKDLEKQIISNGNNPLGEVDTALSENFQADFIAGLGGNHKHITSPISKVFWIGNYQVTALAIPSPGSPQRQLARFGFNGLDWRGYADHYFINAFEWLEQ